MRGFLLRQEITNKQELMGTLRKIIQFAGQNALVDHLTDNELQLLTDFDWNIFVKDNSKVEWRSKSKFVKLFDVQMYNLFNKKILNVDDIGFLTVLSTFINYEDNSLRNKDKKHTYMAQSDIMNIMHWDRKRTYQRINKLIKNKIIHKKKQDEDKRKYKYYINPNLIYRGKKIDKDIKEYYDDQK
jgi:DNA-binding MarR family transcriptional regulator